MLKKLRISNYALIKSLSIDFEKGFYVISGETGSGKTIMLDALSLLLGCRADKLSIQGNIDKCIIEGEFCLANKYEKFFDEHDLDFEEITIIRREITVQGKSRMFINDTPVLLHILSELGSLLVEIHSQNESIFLRNQTTQLDLIDKLVNSSKILKQYQETYEDLLNEESKLKKIKESGGLSESEIQFMRFQFEELETANIKEGERLGIERQLKDLQNIEGISEIITKTQYTFNMDLGLIEMISLIKRQLSDFSSFKKIESRLNSILIEIEDINQELSLIQDSLNSEPELLQMLNNRFDLINQLLLKHKKSTEHELLILRNKLSQDVNSQETFSDRIAVQKNVVLQKRKEVNKLANQLSKKREQCLTFISDRIELLLSDLGMPYSRFKVEFIKSDTLSYTGQDIIKFLFSANKGVRLQELSKIASGGELSRLMLVLKYLIAEIDDIDVLIFDEIDSGVSGEIASLMAEMMVEISKNKQLFAITHLPQIAAKAKQHINVSKNIESGKTITNIVRLNKEERIKEIAKLLSGKEISDAAIRNAKALLNH